MVIVKEIVFKVIHLLEQIEEVEASTTSDKFIWFENGQREQRETKLYKYFLTRKEALEHLIDLKQKQIDEKKKGILEETKILNKLIKERKNEDNNN